MENLHLKNLKDTINISEIYLKKAKDIFNLQTKILEYTSQITMKNTQLEIFKNEFISFFRNYDYICQNEQGAFHRFTQIVTELQNADIGTDISKTSIFEDIHRYLHFSFIYVPDRFTSSSFNSDRFTPISFEYKNLIIEFKLNNGVIENIELNY